MNIKEWINSGIIEAYLLGELDREEAREVEEMARRHPEVKQELEESEMSLEKLAMRAAIKPAEHTKEALFARIKTDEKASRTTIEPTEKVKTVVLRSNSRPWQWLSAATVSLLILTTVLSFYYRQQWQQAESQLALYMAQEQNLSREYQALRTDYEELLERQEDIFTNPDFRKVQLKGTDVAPGAFAVVYWNQESRQLYLNPKGLPEAEDGKQYQLWRIVDGEPSSAGVFDRQEELLAMQETPEAAAFAITLEPEGGSENPTLDQMYVLGELNS
jgi:anti-sigma-K factor RskA